MKKVKDEKHAGDVLDNTVLQSTFTVGHNYMLLEMFGIAGMHLDADLLDNVVLTLAQTRPYTLLFRLLALRLGFFVAGDNLEFGAGETIENLIRRPHARFGRIHGGDRRHLFLVGLLASAEAHYWFRPLFFEHWNALAVNRADNDAARFFRRFQGPLTVEAVKISCGILRDRFSGVLGNVQSGKLIDRIDRFIKRTP